MAITPAMLKQVRADVDIAIKAIAAKYGLKSLTAGQASYTTGTFTMKLEGVLEGALSKEAARYTSEGASFLGLPPLGFEFTTGGRTFKTTGLNTTGSKVICERTDGKEFLYPVDIVKAFAAAKS